MAYSKELRERAVSFRQEGHTIEETSRIFKIGTTTLKKWMRLLSETGKLDKKELNRKPRVYDSEKLRAYINSNPQALLKEIAKHFGGSIPGASDALRREKITLKKRQ